MVRVSPSHAVFTERLACLICILSGCARSAFLVGVPTILSTWTIGATRLRAFVRVHTGNARQAADLLQIILVKTRETSNATIKRSRVVACKSCRASSTQTFATAVPAGSTSRARRACSFHRRLETQRTSLALCGVAFVGKMVLRAFLAHAV